MQDVAEAELRRALTRLHCDALDLELLRIRADFHQKCLRIIFLAHQSHHAFCTATSMLQALTRDREALSLSPDSLAHVWTCSITGLTALRVLRIAQSHSHTSITRGSYRDACVRRIAIETGFLLDDATRCGNPRAERLACARRARCILAEQAVRTADGEGVLERADEQDFLELRAAALRFPDAGGFIQRFRNQTTFSQLAHFTIDASSANR
jgi:hypothetical protein